MSDAVDSSETSSPEALASERRTSRRRLPRFGLRWLFALALLVCLFFGWTGKHFSQVREEQAAIETLKQAGAKFSVWTGSSSNFVGPFELQEPEEDYDPIAKLVGRIGVPASFGPREVQPFERYDPLARWLGDGFGYRLALNRVALRSVDADDPKAVAAVEALAAFDDIDAVTLEGPAFDDASLAPLTRLERLEALSLHDVPVTGAGIRQLGGPPLIRAVEFAKGEPSAELIEGIVSLPWLIGLVLVDNEPVEKGAYAGLAKAKDLRALVALRSGFDDDDLARLATLLRLERLAIDGITDAGLAPLAPLKRLRSVDLYAPVTREAAIEFSAAHPKCLVRWTNPAAGPCELYRDGASLIESEIWHDDQPRHDPFWSYAP
jgi:hypothetical protein